MNLVLRALTLFLLFAGAVQAKTATLKIPAQNLPDALHSLSNQTGIQLLFNAEDMRNLQSRAVEGPINPETALDRLLADTPYTYEASSANTYVIKTAAVDQPQMMPGVKVTGFMDHDAPGNPSYTRTNASTATKSNLPIMKTPVSIQVVPRAVIEDQQAI